MSTFMKMWRAVYGIEAEGWWMPSLIGHWTTGVEGEEGRCRGSRELFN